MDRQQWHKIAAQLAFLLNRDAEPGCPAVFFQMIEETFRVVSHRLTDHGDLELEFQFEGLVNNVDEPVGYLASGSVVVDPEGLVRPGTLQF